jgi:hypothetical protein
MDRDHGKDKYGRTGSLRQFRLMDHESAPQEKKIPHSHGTRLIGREASSKAPPEVGRVALAEKMACVLGHRASPTPAPQKRKSAISCDQVF